MITKEQIAKKLKGIKLRHCSMDESRYFIPNGTVNLDHYFPIKGINEFGQRDSWNFYYLENWHFVDKEKYPMSVKEFVEMPDLPTEDQIEDAALSAILNQGVPNMHFIGDFIDQDVEISPEMEEFFNQDFFVAETNQELKKLKCRADLINKQIELLEEFLKLRK